VAAARSAAVGGEGVGVRLLGGEGGGVWAMGRSQLPSPRASPRVSATTPSNSGSLLVLTSFWNGVYS